MSKKNQKLHEDISENYENFSAAYFASKHNVSLNAVYGIACELKVTSNQRWEKDKDGIIADYLSGYSLDKLGEKYGHYEQNIRLFLEKSGVKTRTVSEANQKYYFDKSFFKAINTPLKAYWLGFIYADGNIYKSSLLNKSVFQIALQGGDRGHLELLKQALKSEHLIYKDRTNFRFMINSIELCDDLMKLGVYPRKSLTIGFPSIDIVPEYLISAFMLGYVDGDGSIQFNEEKKRWRFEIVGTLDFCTKFQEKLIKYAGVSNTKLRQEKRTGDGKIWYMTYGGGVATNLGKTVVKKLYNFLYQFRNLGLERKINTFKRILSNPAKFKVHEDFIVLNTFLIEIYKIRENKENI